MQFLEEVDTWLSERQTEEEGAETVRLGAGAYLIHSNAHKGQ